MRTRLLHLWERVRESLWFIPTCMSVAAVLLAAGAARIEQAVGDADAVAALSFLYRGGPEGARTLLATVAGSMITVAGVSFSVTVVALSLASSQFGPRLLLNFMRDRGNQLVLGTFIATFLFCLIALGLGSPTGRAPVVSASLGLALAVASLAVLIYFIHHVSSSIHAERIIESVARDLERAIDRLFPEQLERAATEGNENPSADPGMEEAGFVPSPASGYIQAIDEPGLVSAAEEGDFVLRVLRRPGHFVVQGEPLVVALGGGALSSELSERVQESFILGRSRTQEQDPEYGIHQLVEIAVRALSPGVNDPYTAISCLDWLGAVLCRIGARPLRSPRRTGSDDELRLIVDPVTFGGVLAAALDQIRQSARSIPEVSIRMLEVLARVARQLQSEERRAAVRAQADRVLRSAMGSALQECDRQDLEARHREVRAALGA